jgi:hypothetical protein
VTWKDSYLPAVLALGVFLTESPGKSQQTNNLKPVGQTSQSHAATTPKKHDTHAQAGNAVKRHASRLRPTTANRPKGATGRRPARQHASRYLAGQCRSSDSHQPTEA